MAAKDIRAKGIELFILILTAFSNFSQSKVVKVFKGEAIFIMREKRCRIWTMLQMSKW